MTKNRVGSTTHVSTSEDASHKGARQPANTCLHNVMGLKVALVGLALASGLSSCKSDLNSPASAALLSESFNDSSTIFSQRAAGHAAITIVRGTGLDGSNSIKVVYKGYPRGSQRVAFDYSLPISLHEATLSYDVKFCPGFKFVRGGKLHGLGPRIPVTGGESVGPEQWSTRVTFQRNGGVGAYIYHQNLAGEFGELTIAPDFQFQDNEYHSVSLYVRLNDPINMANGQVRVFINGDEMINLENIHFRTSREQTALINKILFNTFHGGSTIDFAPQNGNESFSVECAHFDNFAVYPYLQVSDAPGERLR